MAEAYGNVVQHWQAYINAYILSQDNSGATVRCDCYHHSIGWGYNVYGNGEAKVAGYGTGQVQASFYSSTGQTRNQYITTKDIYITKGHSGQNVWCEGIVKHTGGYHNGTSSAGVNVWVGAKPSYTVSYNSNGGSGSPGNQTKWYGENLSLSGTRPSRDGHNFAGWATSPGGSVSYHPGSTYSGNSSLTLYAVWTPHTYVVSYNANGGSGAPGSQTKTYGVNLTLSSTRPSRRNYNFLGWGTSSGSTSVAYHPGGTYTSNSAATLYAIWELAWLEPRITNLQATRCDSAGTFNEEGSYAKVTFDWATDRPMTEVKITCNGKSYWPYASGGQTSGRVEKVVGENALSTENSYAIEVFVKDQVGGVTISTSVAPMNYIMDIAPDGSIGIGLPARHGTKTIEFGKKMKLANTVTGFREQGKAPAGTPYRVLAKSLYTYDNLGSSGKARVFGFIGNYMGGSAIDVAVPFREGHNYTPRINVLADNALNSTESSLQVVVGDDKYIYIVIWRKSEGYYSYDLGIYGNEVEIVNGSWVASRPPGRKVFDSAERFTGIDYPSKYVTRNGYWGFSLPSGAEDDWLRTTKSGIIPYESISSGTSQIGTEAWPFQHVWSNGLNWRGNGLSGMVMKKIWSGSWDSGSINVPNFPKYNIFVFVIGKAGQSGGFAVPVARRIAYPDDSEDRVTGGICWIEGGGVAGHVCSVNARVDPNGTTLRCGVDGDKYPARSTSFDLGWKYNPVHPVRAIFGVL